MFNSTPLSAAAEGDYYKILYLLLKHGAFVAEQNRYYINKEINLLLFYSFKEINVKQLK